MALRVESGFFDSREQVLDDIAKNGTWPTTFISGPSEGLPVHWHSEDVEAYIMEGETDFYDAETDSRTPAKAGDKIVVPARTLHAEGVVKDRVVYIIALPVALPEDQFLVQRTPDEL